jgi:hypothetical protein
LLINQFPRERVERIEQEASDKLHTRPVQVTEIEILEETARTLANELGREYLATVDAETAAMAIEEFTYDDETEWGEAAAEARGWIHGSESAHREFESIAAFRMEHGGDGDR